MPAILSKKNSEQRVVLLRNKELLFDNFKKLGKMNMAMDHQFAMPIIFQKIPFLALLGDFTDILRTFVVEKKNELSFDGL